MLDTMTRRSFLGTCATVSTATGVRALAADDQQTSRAGANIIDCHVHLKHGNAARTEWSPESIIGLMDQVGIGRSVVFAMSTTTVRSIEMAKAAAEKYPRRLIPFVYALPSYERPVLKDIETAIVKHGFRGIKIHAGECRLAEYVIDPVLRLAGLFPVPCLVDVVGNASVARRLAETFPHTPFWLAHMGRYNTTDPSLVEQFIRVAEQHENVSLDLSAVVLVDKLQEAVSRLGAKRLVWGTDGPYKNPTIVGYARTELDKIRKLRISDADRDLILGGNVARALSLPAL